MTCRSTPISAATMPASVVLPSPGGPAKSRWSAAWPRRRAASSMMSRCSFSSRLADELVEAARPQAGLLGRLARVRRARTAGRAARRAPRLTGASAAAARPAAAVASSAARPRRPRPAGRRGPGGPRRARSPSSARAWRTISRARHRADRGPPPARAPPVGAGLGRRGVSTSSRALQLDEQAGGGLLADAGHQAQRVDVVRRRGSATQRRRAGAPTGWPGPGPGRPRGRR